MLFINRCTPEMLKQWHALLSALPVPEKGELPEYVFHGTSQRVGEAIIEHGFRLSHGYIAQAPYYRVETRKGVYFGTPDGSENFAMKDYHLDDFAPCLIAVKVCDLEAAGRLLPDMYTWECDLEPDEPVDYRGAPQTWQESLLANNALFFEGRVPTESLQLLTLEQPRLVVRSCHLRMG